MILLLLLPPFVKVETLISSSLFFASESKSFFLRDTSWDLTAATVSCSSASLSSRFFFSLDAAVSLLLYSSFLISRPLHFSLNSSLIDSSFITLSFNPCCRSSSILVISKFSLSRPNDFSL